MSAVRWASELLDHCAHVAAEIDAVTGNGDHGAAVAEQRRKVLAPSATPSARVLSALRELKLPFARFAMQRSSAHRAAFTEPPLAAARLAELTAMSEASLAEQVRLEAADSVPFDEYLARYLKLARDA